MTRGRQGKGGSLNQDPGRWKCIVCQTSCSVVNHLKTSQDCLRRLKSHPLYQFKGSHNDEVFIVKYSLVMGVCPHTRCEDDQHSEIPPACLEWWKSSGWELMGWRGNRESAVSRTIKEKVREFLKYFKKSRNAQGHSQAASGESTSSANVQKHSKNRCCRCSHEGDLIQHVLANGQCRKAYVEEYLTEDEVDIRNSVFYLGIVLGVCARAECGDKTNFTYLGPHLKGSSECLEFYRNEGIYLSIPNWTKEISPAVISKKIAQLKRKISTDKEKAQVCGHLVYRNELSQLLSHVCGMCGSMGPVIGEDFSLKGGWNGHAWICGNCSEDSPEYDEVKQQLEEKTRRLQGARSSSSRDVSHNLQMEE